MKTTVKYYNKYNKVIKKAFSSKLVYKYFINLKRRIYKLIRIIRNNFFKPIYLSIGFLPSVFIASICLLVFIYGGYIFINNYLQSRSYNLSSQIVKIIGPNDDNLTSKITYDKNSNSYYLNKSSIGKAGTYSPNKVQVGSNSSQTTYSLQMPKDSSKGITYFDNSNGLSFNIAPTFETSSGKIVQNHLVYPTSIAGSQDIYTVKNNGLQEDIAFNQSPTKEVRFSYKLNLPDNLEARLNNNGVIGVYSADPALFGNIKYSSSTDQQNVMNARKNSRKSYLVFAIPAPLIADSKGIANSSKVFSKFELNNNVLTVVANGLNNINGPFTIDPSVVVSSANSFSSFTNEGGLKNNLGGNNISVAGLSGGTISSWTDDITTSSGAFSTPRSNFASVAYGGYLYVIGGGTKTYTQTFSTGNGASPQTWVAPAGVTTIKAEVYGGGGGGGTGGGSHVGSGGGGGGYSSATFTVVPGNSYGATFGSGGPTSTCGIASTFTVSGTTINGGAGCGGGVAGAGSGGTINFTGGTGAAGCAGQACGGAGGGGAASGSAGNNGILNVGGAAGAQGTGTNYASAGASNPVGGAGARPGPSALDYGGGGAGGWNGGIGGNGGDGIVVITWTAPTTYNSDVQYASINGNTLSTPTSCNGGLAPGNTIWCEATGFNNARQGLNAVAYNGYLYLLGGQGSSSSGGCINTNNFCNDVQFSRINSDGSLGSWTDNTLSSNGAFNTARDFFGAAVNNGYLYILGGQASASGTNCTLSIGSNFGCNDVQYAAFNSSDGSLSAPSTCSGFATGNSIWCEATGFNNARQGLNALSNNGTIYILGGQGTSNTGGCINTNNFCNDVQFSKINSDGSLGSWTDKTQLKDGAFNTARDFFGATITHGYIYITGGNTGNSIDTGNYLNDTQFDNINADGSIGYLWQTTTSFKPSLRASQSFVNYDGYLYLLGGLGTYSSSSGCPDNSISGNYCNDVQIATLNRSGVLNNFNSATSLVGPESYAATTVYNGILYQFSNNITEFTNISNRGTFTSPSTTCTAAGGVLSGVWCTGTAALPTTISSSNAVVYNGYLYLVGGVSSNTVYYTKITSNGVLAAPTCTGGIISGVWCTGTGSLPVNEGNANTEVYNGFIYELGGSSDNFLSIGTTYYAAITNTGALSSNSCGTSVTWCSGTALPQNTSNAGSGIYNGKIYVVGGSLKASGASSTTTNIFYATINSNGSLGAWVTDNLPYSDAQLTSVIYNGFLYILGGYTIGSGYIPTVEYAEITSSGALSFNSCGSAVKWCLAPSLPEVTSNATTFTYNGYLYELGGNTVSSTQTSNVYYSYIGNDGPGTVSSFAFTGNNLPATNYNASSLAYNGYLYELGGCSTSCPTSNVTYTSLSQAGLVAPASCVGAGGTLSGVWCTGTASLPSAIQRASSVAYNGYIYEIGGNNGATTNSVNYSSVSANGNLTAPASCVGAGGTLSGVWCTGTGTLNIGVNEQSSTVINNGYIYEIGGYNGSALSNVSYAAINSNGSLSTNTCLFGVTWCSTTNLPTATYQARSIVHNGYIYEIGGINGTQLNTVEYALINANGAIGAWTPTTSLPMATSLSSSVAYGGYLYEIGGSDILGNLSSTVFYAPIYTTGAIGTWKTTNSLPAGLDAATAVAYNGTLYSIGGNTGSGSSIVSYTSLQSMPRTGIGSKLIDTGVDSRPSALVLNGSLAGVNPGLSANPGDGQGGASYSYRLADATCSTFSATSNLLVGINIKLGTVYKTFPTNDGCSNLTVVGRYAWMRLILDDSQSATFPDLLSTHSSITGINYFYHPAPANRLRGGKTFGNNSLQSLDATP